MSVVIAPEFVAAAASNLANIGSTINTANAAAAAPTSEIVAAGEDEVSQAVAGLFAAHAQAYQAIGAEAAAFHQDFVQLMDATAGSYAGAEAANASPLQNLSGLAANAAQNIGYGNIGNENIGFYNYGVSNFGIANTGFYNFGGWNTGYANFGLGNYGIRNIGIGVTGSYQIGIGQLSITY